MPSEVQVNGLKNARAELARARQILEIRLKHGTADLDIALKHMQNAAAEAGLSSILQPKDIAKIVQVFQELAVALTPGEAAPGDPQLVALVARIQKSESSLAEALSTVAQ